MNVTGLVRDGDDAGLVGSRSERRVGRWSAWFVVAVSVAYASVMVAGFWSLGNLVDPLPDPYLAVAELLILVMAPVMVVLMAAVVFPVTEPFGTHRVAWGARSVQSEWRRLEARPARSESFDPKMVENLPEPAQRWLRHAILPGTPLAGVTELRMHGTIRLGTWRRFTATQVLAPPEGYIWAATARVLGLPVVGYDRLSSGTATMRWRLLGVIPVMNAAGPEIARSGAGRLAAEVVLAPTAFRGATWTAGERADTVVGVWRIGGDEQRVEVHIGADGAVRGVLIERWGQPPGAPYGRYPFGVTVEAERTFGSITIPSTVRAGWWWGTDRQDEGEFFRAEITSVEHR